MNLSLQLIVESLIEQANDASFYLLAAAASMVQMIIIIMMMPAMNWEAPN